MDNKIVTINRVVSASHTGRITIQCPVCNGTGYGAF
jgi:hypothetical protein